MKAISIVIIIQIFFNSINAQPSVISPFIKIDQFGYLCDAEKVSVISDPVNGFNGSESFSPGTGINNYQVRDWNNNTVAYQGTIQAWNGGAVHMQSGDRGWYFDFTALNLSLIHISEPTRPY